MERRKREHLYNYKNKNTAVYEHMMMTYLVPKYFLLSDYIDVNVAIKKEKYYIKHYKKLGYNVLNKDNGGSVGNIKISKWNYENCKELSKKYKGRSDLSINKSHVYRICLKNKWLDDFYPKNS
jgi:hypothetical protein